MRFPNRVFQKGIDYTIGSYIILGSYHGGSLELLQASNDSGWFRIGIDVKTTKRRLLRPLGF